MSEKKKVTKKKVTKKKVVKKKTTAKKPNPNLFKKGHTKSKGYGRPKLTEEQKELAFKTRADFQAMLTKYMITDRKELKALVKRNDIPAIDAMVIKSLVNTLESGDQSSINWFLNHTLGKEKEVSHINLTGNMSTTAVDVKNLSKAELLAIKKIHDKNKKAK